MVNDNGMAAKILDSYLKSESEGDNPGEFGIDVFSNAFEDEFPGDADDPGGGTYSGYSREGSRAAENRPWGGEFSDRPKVHELNQPSAAQALGWRVVDLYPNRDFKSEFYRLAGTPSELRQMMQLVQAMRFVTGTRINFEAWFEQWEKGFPEANQNRSGGNFELEGDRVWERIKNPDSRPKYKEFTTSQQRADWGYRVIEYWRDRSQKNSIPLIGTDLQLIQHCIQIEYEGGVVQGKEKINYLTTSRKGFPKIKLYFKEDILDVEPGYRAVPSELNLTIMKPEWKEIANISKNDIAQLAVAVKNAFYNFSFKKGKLTCSYKNLEQGYDNWIYVRSKEEGKRVVATLLAVQGHAIDSKFLKFTETDDETGAYPTIPGEMTVFGEKLKASRRRPIAEARFTHAKIFLPGLSEPLGLVDSAGNIFKASDSLV